MSVLDTIAFMFFCGALFGTGFLVIAYLFCVFIFLQLSFVDWFFFRFVFAVGFLIGFFGSIQHLVEGK